MIGLLVELAVLVLLCVMVRAAAVARLIRRMMGRNTRGRTDSAKPPPGGNTEPGSERRSDS